MENNNSAGATADVKSGGSELTRVQKLAALLLIITEESAAQIMKGLDEAELDAVTAEMSKFTSISYELQQEVLREFSPVAVDASTAIPAGVSRVEKLLEKSVGQIRSSDILARVSPLHAPVAAMQQIVDMDARHIFNLLRYEQVQTIALVASYLTKEKSAQLIGLFKPEMGDQIIERLATLAPTSVEVVESVAEELQRKFGGSSRRRQLNQTGGVKVAAQVLNGLPKNLCKSILSSLNERNAELATAVGKNMFTFEDLERLNPRTLQTILRVVDMRSLAVALKTAPDSLKAALLGAISKRAADTVREEMEFMGPLKMSEIEAAQTEIITSVRQLETDGEIDLDEIRSQPRF